MKRQIPVFKNRRRTKRRRHWGRPLGRYLTFLPGPWLLIDRKKAVIIDGNSDVNGLLGCEREHYLNHPISVVAGVPDSKDWTIKAFDPKTLERPGRYEDVGLERADGSLVVVDVHVSHPPRGRLRQVAICLITDRTEQRRLEGELIKKHQELRKAFVELEKQSLELKEAEEALITRNREISSMSDKLRESSALAAIGEITAELTHQLNNPLAAAVGATRRIEKLVRQGDQIETSAMLELLKTSLERLRSTISELRGVYQTSRPNEDEALEFDLRAHIEGALVLLQQPLETLETVIDLPTKLPLIKGRSSQIQHVIINLLDNAIQAAGNLGTVHILARQTGQSVEFCVGDSGPGVPENLGSKIFEPFFTTREQGSGLGLAVVRRHLDQDGAAICVGRSKYGGAEFKIDFQIAQAPGN